MDRMKTYIFMLLGILLVALPGMAQTPEPGSGGDLLQKLQDAGHDNGVELEMDSLLVANYYKLLTRNKQDSGIKGWRIRIYSKSGVGAKEEQQRIKARFLTLYPDIDAYYRYDEPYFKVYVGDCRTRSEALLLHDRINRNFPNGFIIEDKIVLKHGD